jgi:hypothetical protein
VLLEIAGLRCECWENQQSQRTFPVRLILILFSLGAVMVAGGAAADPLTNDKTKQVRARWVAAKSECCDRVCGAQGAKAENMLVYSSDGGDIYLCRVRKPPANRFGTNYEDICKVEDSDAKMGTALESRYECLCIWSSNN